MEPISKDRAQEVLGFLHEKLSQTVYDAWDKLVTQILPLFPGCSVRGKRNAMYELMIQKARPLFSDLRGVKLQETEHGRILLVVDTPKEHILIRFKKTNEKFETSNYPTQGSLDFDRQFELPWIPTGVRLTVGYLMDADETKLEAVYLFCSTGKKLHWQYELTREIPTAEVVKLPTKEAAPPKKRVRPKGNVVTDLEQVRQRKKKDRKN